MPEPTLKEVQPKIWTRPAVAIPAAAAVLLLGYGDLVRGGLTLSAAMLSLGYLILVPVAIMTVPATTRPTYHDRKKSR